MTANSTPSHVSVIPTLSGVVKAATAVLGATP
jgi:hypothetical protein